jgi:hypothetical protein
MTPTSSTTRVPGSTVKGLNCPNCGAALQIRGFEHTLTVVCPQCLSILDAKDPNVQVLQKFAAKTRITPLIPLGSRAMWHGTVYEAIGYQQRTLEAGGTLYSWSEYLLFNPYVGFRYFTEYNGHWNDVRTLRALPQPRIALGPKPRMEFGGTSFTHFSTAQVATSYVLGEFPWQVRRGEKVLAKDYIAPPKILSSEMTTSETVWSIGEYVAGAEIWQAFKLPGSPPKPVGVYLNQPSPIVQKSAELWRLYGTFLLIALALTLAGYVLSGNKEVFRQRYTFNSGAQQEASFVTPEFTIEGRPTNVEISTKTDLANNWTYFNYALINAETGQAYDFGREVSYYSGRDSDGNWTEGSKGDTATIANIPAGRYYLRVEPEMAVNSRSVDYEIAVRRDVPRSSWFWLMAILLAIPPIWKTFRRFSFESLRWRESDYTPVPSSGGDD